MPGMRISFNGARKNLANAYNRLARSYTDSPCDTIDGDEAMRDLRNSIVGFLCMYDDNDPDDCDCLIDEVELLGIPESGGE